MIIQEQVIARTTLSIPPIHCLASKFSGRVENKCQSVCDAQVSTPAKLTRRPMKPKFSKEDSESQDDEHNFSDLLNLSVCVPSNVTHCDNPIQTSPQSHEFYSVTNSIGSDISSLANLGSPDSPPRATSPTVEMRELLGKIQQLPQQRSPIPPQHQPEPKIGRNYFHKMKAKTLYMPLCHDSVPVRTKTVPSGKVKDFRFISSSILVTFWTNDQVQFVISLFYTLFNLVDFLDLRLMKTKFSSFEKSEVDNG